MNKRQVTLAIAILSGAALLACSAAEVVLDGPHAATSPQLLARLTSVLVVAAGYAAALGLLTAVIFRFGEHLAGGLAVGAVVLASAVAVIASPFVVLPLLLAGRYVIQGVCRIEAVSCSDGAQTLHHALWLGASYPRPEHLFLAMALFVSLVSLALWRGRSVARLAA